MEDFKSGLQGTEESGQDQKYDALNNKLNLKTAIEKVVFWIGTICSVIFLLLYLIIVIVMVVGFVQEARSFIQDIVFAVVTGAVGVIIMQFMKVQGIAFAKSEPNVKHWCEKWNVRRTKERKYHSIDWFMGWTLAKDIIFKLTTIIVMLVGLTYIFIQASNDPMRILFAVANIIMFMGFGLMALSRAYTFYCNEHVEWIKVQLEEKVKAEEQAIKEKNELETQEKAKKLEAEKQALIDKRKAEVLYFNQQICEYTRKLFYIYYDRMISSEVTGSVSEPELKEIDHEQKLNGPELCGAGSEKPDRVQPTKKRSTRPETIDK